MDRKGGALFDEGVLLTQYTWGLDLSGQNGSPGGLLSMWSAGDSGKSLDEVSALYFHDGNGNVGPEKVSG